MSELIRRDIITIDLDKPLVRTNIGKTMATGDRLANRIGVRVVRGKTPVDLTGTAVTGYFIRPDLQTILLEGVADGDTAYVDIRQECLTERGAFSLAIKVSGASVTQTVRIVDGVICLTQTDLLLDPGDAVPTLDELLAQIAAMEQATAEAREVVEEHAATLNGALERDLRRSYDNTTRLPAHIFINGTVSISNPESENYGKVTKVMYMIVTEEILSFPFDVVLAVTNHPYSLAVFRYAEDGTFLGSDGYVRVEQRISAGEYFRVAVYRSDVTSGTADIAEYVRELQVLSAMNAPNTVVSDGTINAMLQIAEPYFNWAYNLDGSSPLIYKGADVDNSLWYTGMAPENAADGVEQYGINCSGFVNVLLQGVPLSGSRYMLGKDAINQRSAWGYKYDSTARIADFWTTVFQGPSPEQNNLGSVFTYDMFRYAEAHGFAYIIADDFSNVRPGDVLFSADASEYGQRYRGISHCVICLHMDGLKQPGDTSARKCVIIHSTEAKRFHPDTPSTINIPVGIAIGNAEFTAGGTYRYGARFPLGAVDSRPTLVASGVTPVTTVENRRRVTHGKVGRGIYTAIIKGTFYAAPNFGFTWESSGINDYIGTIRIDDHTYAVTRYLTDEATLYVSEKTKDGTGTFELESVEIFHGYASPYGDYSDLIQLYNIKNAMGLPGVET